MIRGTTPTLTFTLPFDVDTIQEAWVSFSQNGAVVFNKTLDECTASENTLTVKLTQANTLLLSAGEITEMQIRILTDDDEALASKIISVPTERILKDGVIS